MAPLTCLVPQLPPAVCGVGDYALRLARAWPEAREFHFLAAHDVAASAAQHAGLKIDPLPDELPPGPLLVHYSGFGYDSLGYPRKLIDALIRKKRRGGTVAVMFHELWHSGPWWTRPGMLRWAHRGAVRRLLRHVDAVFTNTVVYRDLLAELAPGREIEVVPVFSTIGEPLDGEGAEREKGLAVLFGMASTRVRALEQLAPYLPRLLDSGRLRRLVLLGGDGSAAWEAREKAWLQDHLQPGQWEKRGILPAGEISGYLGRAEFALSSETWDGFGKSTTFMACLAHGVDILSMQREIREPFCWLTHPEEITGGGVPDFPRGRRLREWYQEHTSVAAAARRFAAAFAGGEE